jgi:flagellar assembly factor FliW
VTLQFVSPRFGPIEVSDDAVIHFERGVPGFPGCPRFIVMDHDRQTPLKWLQCVDRPEVAFLIVEPGQIGAAYELDVPADALPVLGLTPDASPENLAVFLIVNAEQGELTANLRAPIVVNLATRGACQLILDDPGAPLRHPIAKRDKAEAEL